MCLFFRSACNYIKYFGGDENNNEEKEEEKEGTKNILHKTACDRVCLEKEKVSKMNFWRKEHFEYEYIFVYSKSNLVLTLVVYEKEMNKNPTFIWLNVWLEDEIDLVHVTHFNVRRKRKNNMKYNSADFVHSGGDSDHQEVILYKCCEWKYIRVIINWLKSRNIKSDQLCVRFRST